MDVQLRYSKHSWKDVKIDMAAPKVAQEQTKTPPKSTRATPALALQSLLVQRESGTARSLIQRAEEAPDSLSAAEIKSLHHAIGSRAATDMLARKQEEREREGEAGPLGGNLDIQTKLTVGAVGDKYEQQADRVAERVVRQMHVSAQPTPKPPAPSTSQAQREPGSDLADQTDFDSEWGEEEALQRFPRIARLARADANDKTIHAQREVGPEGGPVNTKVESSIRRAQGGGRPVDPGVRSSTEKVVGTSLANMRVHTDDRADKLSESLSARAFTTGSDVFFRKGEYNPGSSAGQRLIAHEATHVIQQTGGSSAQRSLSIARTPVPTIQRQLEFDDSWDPVSDVIAQLGLQTSFAELETLVKAKPKKLTSTAANMAYMLASNYVRERKQQPVSLLEQEAVKKEIDSHLRMLRMFAPTLTLGGTGLLDIDEESVSGPKSDEDESSSKALVSVGSPGLVGGGLWKGFLASSYSQMDWFGMGMTPPLTGIGKGGMSPFGGGLVTGMMPGFGLGMSPMGGSPAGPSLPTLSLPKDLGPLLPEKLLDLIEEMGTGIDPQALMMLFFAQMQEEKQQSKLLGLPSAESTPKKGGIVPPPEVIGRMGRWYVQVPPPPYLPVLTAAIPGLNPFAGGFMKVEDIQLHIFGDTYTVPLEFEVTYEVGKGIFGAASLTSPIDVGPDDFHARLGQMQATYRDGGLNIDGLLDVTLPGVKPFQTSLRYVRGEGLYAETENVELALPPLYGVQIDGSFSSLKYDPGEEGFGGTGHLEAMFPVLGKTTADLALSHNKLERIELRFLQPVGFPAGAPMVSGSVGGALIIENGEFQSAGITGDFDLNLPDKQDHERSGNLLMEARVNQTDLEVDINLKSKVELNQYLELGEMEIEIRRGRVKKGNGAFTLVNVKNVKRTIPINVGDRGVKNEVEGGKTPVGQPSNIDDRVWGSLDYGYDWNRGFYLRGELNAPLNSGKDAIVTGHATYDAGQLDAAVEVGDVQLWPQKQQTKKLLEFYRKVPLYRFGKLAGVYAEAKADVDFVFTVGPLTLDADGSLTDIDLDTLVPRAGLIEHLDVHGQASATLSAQPYVGLGSWIITEALVNLQGGLQVPVSACIGAEADLSLQNLGYKDGKLAQPNIKLALPMIFGLDVGAEPQGHIYALNGLVDQDFDMERLNVPLLAPRKVFTLDFDLQKFQEDPDWTSIIHTDFLTTSKTDEESVKGEGGDDLTIMLTNCNPELVKPPHLRPEKTEELVEEGSALPLDLDVLDTMKKQLIAPEWLEAVEKFAAILGHVADKVGAAQGAVLDWLNEWGVMEALQRAKSKLLDFVEQLKTVTGYTKFLGIIYDIFNIRPDDATPSAESEIEEDVDKDDMAGPTRRYELLLGASKVYVEAVPTANATTKATIRRHRLGDGGLTLSGGRLSFDGEQILTGGELDGEITMGKLGKITDVKMPVDKDQKIAPTFSNADLDATDLLRESIATPPTKISGKFSNTQTKVRRVEMDDQIKVTLKMKDPVAGKSKTGEEIEAAEPVDFILEHRKDGWMLVGRGFSFKGGSLTYEVMQYDASEQGTDLHGKATLKLDALGYAEGELLITKSVFKELTLRFGSEMVRLPKENPIVTGRIRSGLKIDRQGPKDAKLDAAFQIEHDSINGGTPVVLNALKSEEGMVHFDDKWEVFFGAKVSNPPVTLIDNVVRLTKLELMRTPEKGFIGDGEANFSLAGQNVPTSLLYRQQQLTLNVGSIEGPPGLRMKHLNASYGSKNWSLAAGVTLGLIPGFNEIDADLYYLRKTVGFRVHKVEPKSITGMPISGGIEHLEYNTESGKFAGTGYFAGMLPIIGATSAKATIKDSQLESVSLVYAKQVNLPAEHPMLTGKVEGAFAYDGSSVSGAVTGKLKLLGEPETTKKSAESSPKSASATASKSDFNFLLAVGSSGPTGYVQQTGNADFMGLFSLSNLNLALTKVPDVRSTVAKLNSTITTPSKNSKDLGERLTKIGTSDGESGFDIEKKSDLTGSGRLGMGAGKNLRGGLDLNYANGRFQKSKGFVQVGPSKLDKNDGPGISATLNASYSSDDGVAFDSGSITANLAKGLQAEGTIERNRNPLGGGLNAELGIDGDLMKAKNFKKDIIPNYNLTSILAAIPVAPIITIYGKIGASLGLDFTAGPVKAKGKANLLGIDLQERSFQKAYANLNIDGALSAKLAGGPSVGLGAAIVAPQLFGMEGSLKLGLMAAAESKPSIKTALIYEKPLGKKAEETKPKAGNGLEAGGLMHVPLALGLTANVTPQLELRALFDMFKYPWKLAEFGPINLMEPKQILDFELDFGNLSEKSAEQLKQQVPSGKDQMKDAPVVDVPKESVKKQPDKVNTTTGEVEQQDPAGVADNALADGPFNFASLMGMVKDNFGDYVPKSITKLWDTLGAIRERVGELVTATLKNVKDTVFNTYSAVKGFANWVSNWWAGGKDVEPKQALQGAHKALDEVEAAKDIRQVEHIEELDSYWGQFKKYWSQLSTTKKVGYGMMGLMVVGALGYGALKVFGGGE